MSLEQAKQNFLIRYNEGRTIEKAISRAISAAAQHNPLYIDGISQYRRNPIRDFWAQKLIQIAEKYVAEQEVAVYETDILDLKQAMNDRYGKYFRINGDQTGFRISHSQKSISVFLKHLWCMGLIETPPLCPVDRIILGIAGHRNPVLPWTRVNTIEQHRDHVQLLLTAGNAYPKLAHWEILHFVA